MKETNELLHQLTSGKKYPSYRTPMARQQFEYGVDHIGNRTSAKAGGDGIGAGLRTATYQPNLLNQYTNRTVPGAVDITGLARASAEVTVNDQASYRYREYFWRQLPVDNQSGPVWQGVTNRAVYGGETNTTTGHVLVPPATELFSYDADGNLTNDGLWSYRWDGENRLIEIESRATVPDTAKRKLVFTYDQQGRRVGKTVSIWTNNAWVQSYERRFIYDGGPALHSSQSGGANLIGELDGTNNLLRSYLWGTDLSGSMHGADGVGGLLAVDNASEGTHFVACDGNANIMALVHADDGTISANYAYGPFGEPLRASGTMAQANPFRYSTQYEDDETAFLFYGRSFYAPSAGRWLSSGLEGGRPPGRDCAVTRSEIHNTYTFAGNQPPQLAGALGLCRHQCSTLGQACLTGLEIKLLPAGLSPELDTFIAQSIDDLDQIADVGTVFEGALQSSLPGVAAALLANALDQGDLLLQAYYRRYREAMMKCRGVDFFFRMSYKVCESKRCFVLVGPYRRAWSMAAECRWNQGVTGVDPVWGHYLTTADAKAHSRENIEAHMTFKNIGVCARPLDIPPD